VRGVSFVAHHGESIGIVGRNGAGKSTLLRAIAGLIPPSQGTVYVRGTSSLLGVNAALMGQLSGERNIMLGGLALGLTPDQVRKRFDEIVEFAGIGDFVYMPMKAYSSGMAARLRFAISTAAIPDVLMIDEALATGDAEFRARSSAKIREVKDHAGTVFLVSHSNKAITQMCDRAVWIEKGELVMDGPSDEVVAAYAKSLKR
jgi:teichoic acid transport system ATP-binding protein